MSSRTKRFLPKKIERKAPPPLTKPEEFDSVIRESFDFSRKISRKHAADVKTDNYLSYAYQGQIERYRKEVLRRSLPRMVKMLQERYCGQENGQMDLNDVLLSWIELNAPMASYTKMEQQSHVLFAAAIWMLDRITEQENWRRKLYPLLPRNDHEIEEFCEPDFWDCQYEYDLVSSVVNVLYYRNLNVNLASSKGKKARIDTSTINAFEERLQLHEDNPCVLTSEYAATHKLDEDWRDKPETDSYRERFRALMALIPQDDIDEVVEQFRALWSQWIKLFYSGVIAIHKGQDSINDKKEKIAEEHNAIIDELEMLIDSVEEQKRSKTVRKGEKQAKHAGGLQDRPQGSTKGSPLLNPLANPLANHLMVNPAFGKLPNIDQFIKSQKGLGMNRGVSGAMSVVPPKSAVSSAAIHSSPELDRLFTGMGDMTGDANLDAKLKRIESLYMRCSNLEERYDELIDESNTLYRKERAYSLQMASYGRISNGFDEYLADPPSEVQEPMRFPDAYGLCFAFLYLIETRDDMVWLYGAGHGLMAQVCESLPWGIREYEEIGDPVWDNEDYEYEDVPKTANIPDWNERKYADKDSAYYFPRSLAQVLYEETGCVLPRDVTLYYPEYETIRDYGIRGKDAGVIMLMSAVLSTARRQVKANNFDAEYLRFLEKEPWAKENKEAGADREKDEEEERDNAENSTGSEKISTNETDQSKDEKDILIDQLREELKKARASIHAAEVETRNTRKELASTKSVYEREHRELADLREIVFSQQFADESGESEQTSVVAEETYPYETQKRTTVFGGHDTFLKAIKPMLPNVRFIDSSYMTFSPELVRNSDIVWIQTNCISHPMFWNVVKYAKQYGVQLRYLGYASAEKCADQIVEADKR